MIVCDLMQEVLNISEGMQEPIYRGQEGVWELESGWLVLAGLPPAVVVQTLKRPLSGPKGDSFPGFPGPGGGSL